ncbi:chemotaxis protein CheW [Aureimonas sp. AU12]|uniref:chemotaxis protein CheW n=1 Tax=Aureimonas sp. AU12 TaxID=1638161 RepID=UPI0007823F20|nr:chemotaxis protein CheW [Aureimonas sp. AU12]
MSLAIEVADTSLQDYLTVALGDDLFGLKVALVHEVLDPPAMTRIPNAPSFAPGLINVRGNVLPLVDLRARFGMEGAADTQSTRVIVSEVSTAAGETFQIAIKTDAVYEVIHVRASDVSAVPEYGSRWPSRYLDGVVRQDDRFVVLLDVERLLDDA